MQLDDRLSPIDFAGELNEDQYAAVTADPGPALVLAGAGSGKTRTLIHRVAWLLGQGVHPGEILLLTFTNKAAREMLDRVDALTGVPRHRLWGGTFHHIGQKTLRIFGSSIGIENHYTIMDQSDAVSLLTDTIRDLDPKYLTNRDYPKAKVLAGIISLARNMRTPLGGLIEDRYRDLGFPIEPVVGFFKAYQERKLQQQVVDYDDLLEHWLRLLENEPDVAAYFQDRFSHVLVDEYQDTNRLQADIIDVVATHHRIMAVGDDAQCIYTWRGADYENILTFPERHPGTRIYKIETNYRSTPEILDLANGVLATQPLGRGYRKELRPVRSSREIPFVVPVIDGRQQALFIIKRLPGLLEEGYQLGDIAVLYRAHYQALDLQIELSRNSVPFVITSGVRFFEQAHIRDLVTQLRFAANPRDLPAFMRFTGLLPKIGEKTSARLFRLLHESVGREKSSPVAVMALETVVKRVPAAAREEWAALAATLIDIETSMASQSPAETVQIAIDGWYGDFMRTIYQNWETRRDDIDSLVGFAARFDEMPELLAQLVLLNSETSDRGVDDSVDALRLTTVHQAKGLEFAVVFVIGLADGLFPLKRALDEDNLEEERRLFYVAVTRARDELYLSYPMINTQGGPAIRLSASRFLSELPEHCYEVLRVRTDHAW